MRECVESEENQRGLQWGVINSGWNGVARGRGHKAWDRGNIIGRTAEGQVWKGADIWGVIRLASLNIRTGRVGGLETALRVLQKGKVDVGFLQETKLTQVIHNHYGAG